MIGVKEIFWNALQTLEHNDRHYTTLSLFGRQLQLCSRCTGTYLGIIFSLPFVLYLYLNYSFDFNSIFIISWCIVLFPIADWTSVKAGLWKGNNNVRLVTGFMLGSAGLIYLFLLPVNVVSPVSLIIKYLTLCLYGFVFSMAHYGVKCRELDLSLKNPVRQNLAVMYAASPLAVVSCGQTGGCGSFCNCCPCGGMCCISPLCCCIGICPLICIMKSAMDKKAPKKGAPNAKK